MLPEKRDLVLDGLGRLKSQWLDKPVIQGLVKSYLTEIQKLEDSAEFLKNISLNSAMGEDLNRIGRLWNVPRLGRSDAEYRIAILSFVSSIDPDISPEGIMEALRTYGQTDLVQLHEHFPAFTQLYMGEGFSTDMHTVNKTLIPAATGVSLFVDTLGDSIVFGEEVASSEILVTHDDEGILLTVDTGVEKLWGVNTSIIDETLEYFSEFAEEGDVTFHPFAEELNRGVLVDVGDVVDNSLEEIIDDEEEVIIYTNLRFKD